MSGTIRLGRSVLLEACKAENEETRLQLGRPGIVCISGSTRFMEQMAVVAWGFESLGEIALGCHLLPKWFCSVESHFAELCGISDEMDKLHLRKIDMADRLFVVNFGGYIGESTRREIEYATKQGKPVRYLVSI